MRLSHPLAVLVVVALVAAGCSRASGSAVSDVGDSTTASPAVAEDDADAGAVIADRDRDDAELSTAGNAEPDASVADADGETGIDADTETDADDEDPVAVVVRAGGLDDAFLDVIRSVEGVDRVATLRSGQVRMTASEDQLGQPVDQLAAGFVIQLEARAYDDPGAIAPFAPELAAALATLGDGELILSRSSAELRRLDVGGVIEFDNEARFTVGAILDDAVVGGAEVLLVGADAFDAAGAVGEPRRVALVGFEGTGEELEAVLLTANGGEGVRVFGGGGRDVETDRQRSTLSQIAVKQTFGEFAFRPNGSSIEIDPAWVEANIVVVDLPLLGSTRCHREFAETLTAVMQGLIDDGLADLIDPGAFQGCWNPRTIAGSTRLSKHAWGIAADINFGNSLDDQPGSPVHPELLDRMNDAGFVSGHLWTTPDPGHFEYRRPPLEEGLPAE